MVRGSSGIRVRPFASNARHLQQKPNPRLTFPHKAVSSATRLFVRQIQGSRSRSWIKSLSINRDSNGNPPHAKAGDINVQVNSVASVKYGTKQQPRNGVPSPWILPWRFRSNSSRFLPAIESLYSFSMPGSRYCNARCAPLSPHAVYRIHCKARACSVQHSHEQECYKPKWLFTTASTDFTSQSKELPRIG